MKFYKMRRVALIAAISLTFFSIFSFAGPSHKTSTVQQILASKGSRWLFVITSKHGAISKSKGAYVLSMPYKGVGHVLAFSQRPARLSTMLTPAHFKKYFWSRGKKASFANVYPNAVAVINGSTQVAVLTSMKMLGSEMQFGLKQDDKNLIKLNSGQTALFIDCASYVNSTACGILTGFVTGV